ncbi:MAG: hypothetical protein J5793_01345 [Clostridia bacterium]|nr:hypothetical protein [Clostridia bacterium]
MGNICVRLAGVPVGIEYRVSGIKKFFREYIAEDEPLFTVRPTDAELESERAIMLSVNEREGREVYGSSDFAVERQAIFRAVANRLFAYGVILFHGSAIAVDGEGYIFGAPSGTGKSTHTRLWREKFGERALMINDDKPFIRIGGDGVFVYGSPWNGKHGLSSNVCVPLKAVAILKRGENRAVRVGVSELLPELLGQIHRPDSEEEMEKLLDAIVKMGDNVGFYRVWCDMSLKAAETAFEAMRKG